MSSESEWTEVSGLQAAIDHTYLGVRKEIERRLPGALLFHVGPTAFYSLYCRRRVELEIAVPVQEMQRAVEIFAPDERESRNHTGFDETNTQKVANFALPVSLRIRQAFGDDPAGK